MQSEDAISLRLRAAPSDPPRSAGASFDYREAFSRNIGWLTEAEQQRLRGTTVAIAGMGGVGSAHLLVLARMGVGGFTIADLDRFEIANFNRQTGATISTVGRPKVEVMAEMARDINPELRLSTFPEGVDDGNLDAFLSGADLFVDGLDFFAMEIRRAMFARCAALGIPAITAAPVGFGTAYIVFMPGRMTFEQLFRMEGLPAQRQYVNFATALAPRGLHRPCLADPSRVDLAGRRGPSTGAAISLCAGVVAAEATKIVLGRGPVRPAPWVHQFDAFRSRWRRSWLPFGNAGPLQSVKRTIGYRVFDRLSRSARPREEPVTGSDIARILDAARWAPSGDNAQPWRFRIVDDSTVIVDIRIEGESRNIYDFNRGQPTLLSAGFLLETVRIAASRYGRRLDWRLLDSGERGHRIEIALPRAGVSEDPLFPYITIRSVDRTPYRLKPLATGHKEALEAALGERFEIRWLETAADRWRAARLNARATDIRLRLREAYAVHTRILDWGGPFSTDGVPAQAVGLDPLTSRLMRWVMRDWRRVAFLNRYLAGTLMPRVQLDLIPGLCCAAQFFVMRRPCATGGAADAAALLNAGAALQRFWLTATQLGLALQPGLAPLCFAHYAREGGHARSEARRIAALARRLRAVVPGNSRDILFAGRLGVPGRGPAGRSLRRPLDRLIGG